MKRIVILIVSFLVLKTIGSAQCTVNYKEILNKYCTGEYLMHQELDNQRDTNDISLILKKDNIYAIYLLNPSHKISEYRLVSNTKNFSVIENRKEDVLIYKINVDKTREIKFSLNVSTDEKACVLMAIYLQNNDRLKPGIYKSFEDLKNNNPITEYTYLISEKKIKYNKNYINIYRIDADKEERRKIGKIYGFCDGKDVYVNRAFRPVDLSPLTIFTKAENLKKYYYFQVLVSTQYGYTMIEKLLNLDTGNVFTLNTRSLTGIMNDDAELLEEFDQASQKRRRLREYLIKYIDKHYPN